MLEQTTQFNVERYVVGLLWRGDEVKLPNNFYSAMVQLNSLERRLEKDKTPRKRYQETIDTDVYAGHVRKVDQTELIDTRNKLQWSLPHHLVINPQKPENIRRVCNAAAKYKGVALNDKLLSGPDLLQSLVELIFCFREHQIAFSADIEAIFLQIAVPSDKKLRFLWREHPEQKWKYTSTHDTFLGRKACRLLQTTLCTKWRKIMQSTTKVSSKRFSKTSTWSTS